MERLVFHGIPERGREERAERILRSFDLPPDTDPETLQDLRALVLSADALADPKAILRVSDVTETGCGYVTIDGVRIESPVLREAFAGLTRVFPYVCTCGTELENWSRTLDDPLYFYYADQIKLFYVGSIQSELFAYVRRHYVGDTPITHINPGVKSGWPLAQHAPLFSLIGRVREDSGVTLNGDHLMEPAKSTSGILFECSTPYDDCSLCPLKDCPGRRETV